MGIFTKRKRSEVMSKIKSKNTGLELRFRYGIINPMKHSVRFHISKGESHYVAQGIELPIVTQGKTLKELKDNIREATALHLE